MKCLTCNHYSTDNGECRVRAPQVVVVTVSKSNGPKKKPTVSVEPQTRWPVVDYNEWCGEWRKK